MLYRFFKIALQTLPFLLFFLSLDATAQKLEGTVRDENGQAMPFATILIKGTPTGTTTNKNGHFSIDLSPGTYTVDCRFVGYTSQEKKVTIKNETVKIHFEMVPQELQLNEVVIKMGGEDPAYEIIRNAIKKRPEYEKEVKAFEAEIYIKGLIQMQQMPDKILGRPIPKQDRKDMGLDSTGKGIIYLSESITKVYSQLPDKFKLEIISSRVSGSKGFGFDFPAFINLYQNNVTVVASQLNLRGFVSPIADGALNFYNYKLLGVFFEDGNQVNVIKVMPKRSYEPLFSGVINITENDWRIFSCDLLLTKTAQLQIFDSLSIKQTHSPVEGDIWRIRNQSLHFKFNTLGIKATGDFVNVYSKYKINPTFPKGLFDRVIIKYDTAATSNGKAYWDSIRPVPLEPQEIKDYKEKDSLLKVRTDSVHITWDTLRQRQGPLKLSQVLWSGVNRYHYDSNFYRIQFDPLIKTLQYNTVEGVAINPSFVFSKTVRKTQVNFIADVRYGFNNQHLNPWIGFTFNNRPGRDPDEEWQRQSFFIAGGKRVSQFFHYSDVSALYNSFNTLIFGHNRLKIYENYFAKAGFSKRWESSATLLIEGLYEDRIPIENTTDFIFDKNLKHRLTPNYPTEIMNQQFTRHKAVLLHASFSFQPGQRYIQFPKYKMAIGSKFPTFKLDYTKGFKDIFGSDVDYDKWEFNVKGQLNLKLAGSIKYNLFAGGFLNSNKVYAQDYKHFYGNTSIFAGEYLISFQNATTYQFSNQSKFYTAVFFEHHANGLLTNKIPLLRKLNWNLVEGINLLYINPNTRYAEVFIGLENIFKIMRVDLVAAIRNGYYPGWNIRFGFAGLLGDSINSSRFVKRKKIIDEW